MKYKEDSNGFVHFEKVPISKAGVFPYLGSQLPATLGLNPDQIYMVYRPEEALNNPETMDSFKGMPWFNRHEMAGEGMRPTEQIGAHGSIGDNVVYSNGTLFGNLHLFGQSLKESIKSGLKELSCGFKCVYELASGTFNGKQYQVMQKQIRGNHLASVPEGRMGSEVSVAMDQLTFAIDELEIETNQNGEGMTIEEMIAKVKEAQPAKAELEKLVAEIGAMLEGGEPEVVETPEMDMEPTEEPEVPAEDEEKEEKEEFAGMDAAAISTLIDKAVKPLKDEIKSLKGSAMDERSVMKSINRRNKLGAQIAQVVGGFNYEEMTEQEVAKYGVDKIEGLACDSGEELSTVKGYLTARQQPTFTIDNGHAKDSADVNKSKTLDEMGL